jgi:hypothetical protein
LERGKKSSTLPETYIPTSFGKREKKGEKKSPRLHPTQETTLGKKGEKVSTPFFPHFF